MKLYYALPSPYVRKVLVVADELGLASRIERIDCHVSPLSPDASLNADNPLGKIPCLVTDDGLSLYDSRVICEYLDSAAGGGRLIPAEGERRWKVLRLQALADGMLDALVATRYETFLRPEQHRWDAWIEGQLAKADRALDFAESQADNYAGHVCLGTIALACALGYWDFRYVERPWRSSRPKLAKWFETFSTRPSMVATKPA